MLFNSYEFIFLFLPITVAAFFLLARMNSPNYAYMVLIASSAIFYGAWAPINVAIIAPSIAANFLCARYLSALTMRESRRALPLLLFAIAANIVFLGYFKYRNFFLDGANGLFGAHFQMVALVLPLGISFITFQKIAFLVDVYSGRVKDFSFLKYLLFVLFFPQLIAGPIVHYREMMPQFERISLKPNFLNFSVGITLFSIGLFKKVVIADGVARYATPIFVSAAAGQQINFFWAWGAALAFTLQIYFDFSGYSDMALGLARLFGIRLPLNFNSPFKASSMIEMWSRWHVTLTRFLTGYVYTPIVMSITRRRMEKGLPVKVTGRSSLTAFVPLVVGPTMITMGLSGFWHGAGLQFICWGLLHGTFLTINHAWRLVRPQFWKDGVSYERMMKPVGLVLTFTCFVIAVVFFRSDSVSTAISMLKGMIGLQGIAVPAGLAEHLSIIHRIGLATDLSSGQKFVSTWIWIGVLIPFCLLLPNSLEILSGYEPALGFNDRVPPAPARQRGRFSLAIPVLKWQPGWSWGASIAGLSTFAVASMTRVSEFLYWQF